VARVRARRQELGAANAVLMVISAEPAVQIAPVAQQEGWTGPVLGDPERVVYRAFGLGRLPWHRVFTLKTVAIYFGLMLRGRFPQPPGQDAMQQGGDFIVDGEGIIRFAYPGRTSDDRPPVDALMGALRSAAQDLVGPGFVPGRAADD
jgi:hypothetical protein